MKRIYFVCMFLCLTTSFAVRLAQAQTETVLYNFPGSGYPSSSVIFDSAGNLYGTTYGDGVYGSGTVFELSPNGSGGWNETVLHNFGGAGNLDGGNPSLYSHLIFDIAGNLYGTTEAGGSHFNVNDGTVFKLSPIGSNWQETILYSFTGGTDGYSPLSALVMDPAGNLYGTTSGACRGGFAGAVFELSQSGGVWTEQTIYSEPGASCAGLTMDAAGNIYGVTSSTVFKLSPNGSGGWNPSVIHTFAGTPTDGGMPEGTLVLDNAGSLYGTTEAGGAHNYGTVYKLSGSNQGTWTQKILYSFKGGKNDGNGPVGGIVFDTAGNIYGTTANDREHIGYGTVFELVAPVGTGSYVEKILWSFNGADGANPYSGLILDNARHLYGTANSGGSSGAGVVFEVTVPATWTTTTLSSSPNPSVSGQAVTFNAVVTSSLGPPPDGEIVTFKKGAKVLGTGTLTSGSATFTTSTLPVGTNSITAAYGGDSKFGYSTSNAVKQVVNKAATTTTLTSSLNPSNFGQSVTFTASVAPQFSGTVTGTVTFYDGATALKTVALSGGVAKFTTSTLTSGSHTITATYGGSTSFIGSSASLTQTVN
jgi:uncharacterized repeat protein (TIGR03803 family)